MSDETMGKRLCAERAVIFDLDGVLTDTAEYHYQAWRRLANEEGIPFSRSDNEALRGVSRRASLELILKDRVIPEDQMEQLMERKNGYYREQIKKISRRDLLPGAEELLDCLAEKGVKMALASASKNARDVLAGLGIGHYFLVIADGYSVKNTKPAPDLFLYAAEKLGVPPECCIVIEDAAAGVEGARAAKMAVLGIGPAERVGEADLVFDAVDTINVQEMLSLVTLK